MDVQKLMKEISQSKKMIEDVQKGILFYGNTGVGKSTLVNYIVQNPDLIIEKNKYKIKDNSSNQFFKLKIGSSMNSATSIPITVIHKNIAYRDLPGFKDNRQNGQNLADQDFMNSFYYYEVLKKTRQLKIVLVFKATDIEDRATSFSQVIREIKQHFGSLSDIKKSTLIIFGRYKDQEIDEQMQEFIDLCKENSQTEEADFIQHILDQQNYFKFKKLSKILEVNFDQSNKINQKLQKLDWIQNNFKNEVILSEATKAKFGKYRQKLVNQMNQTITQISKTISSELKKLYDAGKKSQLIFQMVKIKNELIKISKQTDRKVFFQHLEIIFKKHQDFIKLLKSFEVILDFLDFISQINAQKSFYDIREIFKVIYNSIESNINSQTKIIIFNESDVAYVTTTKIITSKEIQSIIFDNFEFNNFFFFLESAEINSNISAKGKNLLFFAKVLKTPNNTQININLSGNDAGSIKEISKNKDGRPGLNGQNGGCLYLKVNQIIGQGLTIQTYGGKGGDGQSCKITDLEKFIPGFQNGKIFQQDCKNQDNDKVFLKNRDNYDFKDKTRKQQFTHVVKAFTTFNGQVLETYQTDTIRAWSKYYKLLPGDGGHPGKSGKVVFIPRNNTLQIDLQQSKRKIKEVTKSVSKGQEGSLIIDRFQGKFLRQVVFGAARQQGRKFSQQTKADIIGKQILLGGAAITGQILAMEAAQTAMKQAAKKAFLQTGKKVLAQQLAKQTAKQVAQQTAKEAARQAAKAVVIQSAESVAISGLVGAGLSLGGGLAIQGILSPVVAYLSDQWKQKPIWTSKVNMKVPKINPATDNGEEIKQIRDNQLSSLQNMYSKLLW